MAANSKADCAFERVYDVMVGHIDILSRTRLRRVLDQAKQACPGCAACPLSAPEPEENRDMTAYGVMD